MASGGNVAERSRELGLQFRLIALHEQEIVGAAFPDGLDDRLHCEGRIARDDRALKRQRSDRKSVV